MKKFVIFSTQVQHRKFIESGYKPLDFQIACDNETLYPFLDGLGYCDYLKINDRLARESWIEINQSACGQAAAWIGVNAP